MDIEKMEYEEMLRNYKSYKRRKASLQKQYGENGDEIERLKKQNKIETEAINDINNKLQKTNTSQIDKYNFKLRTIENKKDKLCAIKGKINQTDLGKKCILGVLVGTLVLLVGWLSSLFLVWCLGISISLTFGVAISLSIVSCFSPVIMKKYCDKKIKKLNKRFFQISKNLKKTLEKNPEAVSARKALLSEKNEHEQIVKQNTDRISNLSYCNQKKLDELKIIEFELERILHRILIQELDQEGIGMLTVLEELVESEEYEKPKVKKLGSKK